MRLFFLSNDYNYDKKNINLENLHNPSDLKVKVSNMNLEINENNLLVNMYLEDERAKEFFISLFNYFGIKIENYIRIINVNLGWTNYLYLIQHNVPEFTNNLIVLDNDVLQNTSNNLGYLKSQKKCSIFAFNC